MTENYLLFGGSGFIGGHIVNYIVNLTKQKAFVFDIEPSKSEGANYEQIDVKHEIITKYSPLNTDVILNLSAIHRTPGHPSNEYFETNLLGAKNVCDYARKYGVNTIVFTSSIAVYGTYEEQKTEDTVPMPDIPYGISKLTAEYIHKLWQLEDPEKRKLIIVRPGVVFGENENGNFTRLINSISKNRFFYPGRRDTIKACIYVKDLVDAIFSMITKEASGVCTYNMTYDPPPSIVEICETISEKARIAKPYIKLPATFLLIISRIVYMISRNENYHPDRVRKLMISNNINGMKLNSRYLLKFGLSNGIQDWMNSTNFNKENGNIY
ncbi:MAG: SDR family oxidoreductase [Flavobacteriaceae bacterium]